MKQFLAVILVALLLFGANAQRGPFEEDGFVGENGFDGELTGFHPS